MLAVVCVLICLLARNPYTWPFQGVFPHSQVSSQNDNLVPRSIVQGGRCMASLWSSLSNHFMSLLPYLLVEAITKVYPGSRGRNHRLYHLMGEVLRLCCLKGMWDGRWNHFWKICCIFLLQSPIFCWDHAVVCFFQILYIWGLEFLSFIVFTSLLRLQLFTYYNHFPLHPCMYL